MRLEERARELDRHYVPLMAERTRASATRLARWWEELAVQRRKLADTKPAELDERYAANRLLRMVRDIPQLGFVIIAAVFLAGTATAVVGHHPAPARPDDGVALEQPPVDPGNRLGPEIGETTSGYEATALQDLKRLAGSSPASTRLALVSFRAYATPAQVEALLGSYQVRRVYLRAAVGGPEAAQLPYEIRGVLGPTLRRAYADVALSRLAVQRSYQAYVETTTDDKAYHDDYAAYAASTGREVSAYQHSCACLFSAVVEAPVKELLALRGRPEVRAVQVAGKDRPLTALVVEPLLPETKGLVTKGPVTAAP